MLGGRTLFYFDAPSAERAKSFGYRWEQYRRLSWIPALIALLIVLRELLPVPRLFGDDDE